MASTPASAHNFASSGEVTPQIFTRNKAILRRQSADLLDSASYNADDSSDEVSTQMEGIP
jgi:hypothetical protein